MGEAKMKEERRREHATGIVVAFENFIYALSRVVSQDVSHERTGQFAITQADLDLVNRTRETLIDTLVTPPPK